MRGFRPREVSRWIRTAFFMQIRTFRPQFHNSGPPSPQISWKSQKYKMSLLTFSELCSNTRLSPKSSGQTYGPKIILWWSSLYQLFGEKFNLTVFFQYRFRFFMENHFFMLSRLGFILKGFCSPLDVFLSYYYYFLFLAPLWGGSEARHEFSKFLWGDELSTTAYSDNIWPTGKILKKNGPKHMCFSVESWSHELLA